MIIINKYGEEELFCDECGISLDDDEEIYKVDDRIMCIHCLKKEFKVKE